MKICIVMGLLQAMAAVCIGMVLFSAFDLIRDQQTHIAHVIPVNAITPAKAITWSLHELSEKRL